MNVANVDKFICCMLATILLFMGIGVAMSANNSSSLCTENTTAFTDAVLSSVEYGIEEPTVCSLSMLNNSASIVQNSMTGMIRWQDRGILMFFIVGSFLQYLFYYQSAECKEDGQLFLCRSAVVDYIHLKDSGE